MIWHLTSISFANEVATKDEVTLLKSKKTFIVLKIGNTLISETCKDITRCFDIPHELIFFSNQNPAFSLCFQSNGKPHFAIVNSDKRKVTLCERENKIVDLETLMKKYKYNKK